MRRKHYAIGAAVLTAGVAALVLMPKHEAGLGGIAYLPSGMQSVFNAPAIQPPVAQIDVPAVEAPQPQAPAEVAEIPTSAPVDIPPATPRAHTSAALPETQVADNTMPTEQPFVWHGSASGQSWKGTGGRVASLNNGPSAPGGGGGGGGGGSGGVPTSSNNLPDVFNTPPSLPPETRASNTPKPAPGLAKPDQQAAAVVVNESGPGLAGAGNTGTGLSHSSGSSNAILDNGDGLLHDAGHYASYEKPSGDEQVVAVDEPGALSLLLFGTLGLLVARRSGKRSIAA